MQFSEHWLREFVDPPLTGAELAHLLTMAGLEVEALRPVAQAFAGVVVAQVLAIEAHPNADRLKLCRVDAGQGEELRIVCGAPNVAVGMKVPCALIGAQLPGVVIRSARVRDVESFGMLCSARELGLSDDHSGLLALAEDAPVGADVRAYLDLDDNLFTLKLTPNRADCLSLKGVAREVAALCGAEMRMPAMEAVPATLSARREIFLDAALACPRYCGRIISGIDARAATPAWMKSRLERSGIRSISAVVDVTNYVMLELGQPLHAFDNALLSGAIHVRFPRSGERLVLLNEQDVEPSPDTLLIADEARALALAGIMGGEESGISERTSELFLESAFFSPDAVAGKARSYGFSSDASYRFERGVDFAATREAMERATRLILDICGGTAGPVTEALADLPRRDPVRLRASRADKVIGVHLGVDTVARLLGALGFPFARDGEIFTVTPPSYRFDVAIEEDLIEELARLHGYDNIPADTAVAPIPILPSGEARRSLADVRRRIVGRDYQEVVNYSFVDADWETDFCANAVPLRLANPIASQMSVMRTSLIGGLVANLAYNLKRRVERIRLFEIGRCFRPTATTELVSESAQPKRVAGLAWGGAVAEQWGVDNRPVDFFDVKADVEGLLDPLEAVWERAQHPAFHPGRCAAVIVGGMGVGILGELHPRWVQKYELAHAPVIFELELEALVASRLPRYTDVSRFPPVVRDLALVVGQTVPVQALLGALQQAAPAAVREIRLFDVYQGKGIEENKKSLAFRVVMQDTEKTLSDSEVEAALLRLREAAERDFAAKLRA